MQEEVGEWRRRKRSHHQMRRKILLMLTLHSPQRCKLSKVKQQTKEKLDQVVWKERLFHYALPTLVFIVISAVIALLFVPGFPISKYETTCRFVRWTKLQSSLQASQVVVYCDLEDGTMVLARAPEGWVPPESGAVIKLSVMRMLMGVRYYIE